jgi:hypothetical protein
MGLVRRILLRMKSWMNYTPLRLAAASVTQRGGFA